MIDLLRITKLVESSRIHIRANQHDEQTYTNLMVKLTDAIELLLRTVRAVEGRVEADADLIWNEVLVECLTQDELFNRAWLILPTDRNTFDPLADKENTVKYCGTMNSIYAVRNRAAILRGTGIAMVVYGVGKPRTYLSSSAKGN